jgi:hypothetical protein
VLDNANGRLRPSPHTIAGLDATPSLRASLHDWPESAKSKLCLKSAASPPLPYELLRLELADGRPLNDPTTIAQTWHRPPYAIGLRLARYAPGAESGEVVDEVVIDTRGSRGEYRARLEAIAARLVKDAISGTSRGPLGAALPDLPAYHLLSHGESWVRHSLARCEQKLLREWWSLGIADRSREDIAVSGSVGTVRWLEPDPRPAYLADPFPLPATRHVLCEEMPMAGGHGRIVAVDPDANSGSSGVVRTSDVLSDDYHHSYPYLFQEGSELYFVPETPERGRTVLYRLNAGERSLVCNVAPARSLADPTLFKHQRRYWIACTDLDVGRHDNLCLFHAEQLSGPWKPHRLTPVKIDVRGARPAGPLFTLDGRLIRPAQDCARTYGGAVTLNRIDHLTEDEFRETPFQRISPDPSGPFPDGLHTISSDGVRTWIDGKRMVFYFPAILHNLVERVPTSLRSWRDRGRQRFPH